MLPAGMRVSYERRVSVENSLSAYFTRNAPVGYLEGRLGAVWETGRR
jgi:hypothetical protein